jgi:hypothetical protein
VLLFPQLVELGRKVADSVPGSVLWAPGVLWITIGDSEHGWPPIAESGRVQRFSDVLPFDALPMLDDWATLGVVWRACECRGAAFNMRRAEPGPNGASRMEYQGVYAHRSGEERRTDWKRSKIEAVAAVAIGVSSD